MSGFSNLMASTAISGAVSPVVSRDFLTDQSVPTWLDYSGITGHRMMYDSTGKLTYAPNNELLNTATLSTQNVTTIAANYVLSIKGTGSVTLTGTSTAGPLNGTGASNRVDLAFTPTAGTLTLTVSGSVTDARLSRVTYETTMRTIDDVNTTSAAYYGPRFDFPNATAAGLLIEESRTNVVLQNRDLTNASWTKTNVTAVKDQTGIDGVANSASKITASAGNGTVTQSITLASSARFQTAFVKRITGTGTVNMTMDGGSTWTAVTVTGSWTRVSIPTQTLANPAIGFQIVTNGDAIAVDFVQNEDGAFATSPIFTTTASVTRAADNIKFSGTALTGIRTAAASFIVETNFIGAVAGINNLIADTVNQFYLNGTTARINNNSTENIATIGGGASIPGVNIRTAFGWDASSSSVVANNGTLSASATGVTVQVNVYLANNAPWAFGNGYYRGLSIYNSRLPNSTLQTKSTVGGSY